MIQLNALNRPIPFDSFPANNDPKAIAKVKPPEIKPTCAVDSSNPFCQIGIVADNPTIHPDPNIEPIPAAVANWLYSLVNEFFEPIFLIDFVSPFIPHIYINRFHKRETISKI